MFHISPNNFLPNPCLTTHIGEREATTVSMAYFDRDGYELNALEQLYHAAQGVQLSHQLYHTAHQQNWIMHANETPRTGAIIDHSLLLTRFNYGGDARKQLNRAAKTNPVTGKLLKITQKWGIDFSLDWVTEDDVCELLHIEVDRYNLDELLKIKHRVETVTMITDFEHAHKLLVRRKDEWQHLASDDQDDWKAQFFGFERAFDNRKAY